MSQTVGSVQREGVASEEMSRGEDEDEDVLAEGETREDDATCKKMGQIDKRLVFELIKLESLTEEEKKKAIESLLFLNEKRDGTIKACACANGSTQRSFMPREEAASPTVGIDSVLMIEYNQMHFVGTCSQFQSIF